MFKRTRIPEVVPEVLPPKHAEPSGSAVDRSLPGRLLAEVAAAAAPRVAVRESAWADNHTSSLEPYPEVAEVAPSEITAQTDPEEEFERAPEPEVDVAVAQHDAVREDVRVGDDAPAAEPSSEVAEFPPTEIAAQPDPEGELERGPEPEVAEAEAPQAAVREDVRADDDPSALETSPDVAEVAPSEIAALTVPYEEYERRAPEPTPVAAEVSPPATTSAAGSAVDTVQSSEAEEPPAAPRESTCKISVWRGYRKAAFYAGSYHDGEEVAIAESKMFRAGGNGIPDRSSQSEEAYKALCDQLERDGWKRVSRGNTWFGDTFRRELTVSEGPAPE